MAIVTSQSLSVISDLYDLLSVQDGLSGVAMFRMAPGERDAEGLREYITIANSVTDIERVPPYLHPSDRNETFTINGRIVVVVPGAGDDVAFEAMRRALELFAEVDRAVRTDITLGRSQGDEVEPKPSEHLMGANEIGRVHQMDIRFECKTRLIGT